ncbi:SdpI family protein [Paeniglutamicibacter sp. Y32M11]|uniref:SdpI family protein n=1 Tax=Paeniglutamicibacter sp. Y32M11 TaxID=2853258 RepID=UPI001C5309CA|nr:SdpI family protein [Paeniglutamicibacter sp. Y32M11]QXQ09629.1 SdpI family protein [Paeniglutamicibacter sp. Y32M11]
MNTEQLTLLITTVIMVLIMAAMIWMMKAAANGAIKPNPWIGLRTTALMHCETCWLLGHHAAASKSIWGFASAAVVMAVAGIATVAMEMSEAVLAIGLILGMVIMVTGLILGLRDANRAVAKIHAGERIITD